MMVETLIQAGIGGMLAGFGLVGYRHLASSVREAHEQTKQSLASVKSEFDELRREHEALERQHTKLVVSVTRLLSTLNGQIPSHLRADLESAIVPEDRPHD